MKNILPVLQEDGKIENGKIIEALSYCIDNCNKKKCEDYYSEIRDAEEGFYTCPKGLTSYISTTNNGQPIIYTSMRIKGYYHKGSDRSFGRQSDPSNSPVISADMFMRLMDADKLILDQLTTIDRVQSIHTEMLHDIKKICAHVKNKSEDIIALDDEISVVADSCDISNVLLKVKTIEAMSGLAVSRFDVYDIKSHNPFC